MGIHNLVQSFVHELTSIDHFEEPIHILVGAGKKPDNPKETDMDI